ncbi:MAG: 5-formaminoimidazole-4-carboxamide-1-(beta)-D-ribofuranosyl 5'-monophosphate synthetase, partial [Thermoplasmata archaeon HGW-Thermoplasmata-1]
MIERKQVWEIVDGYDAGKLTLGVIGSHSALDVCDGSADEGIANIAICQKGREKTYDTYFRAVRDSGGKRVRGYVDETWVFDRYNEILRQENQKKLVERNSLFVPNRSFTSYCAIDAIENDFMVPMLGSRNLLRSEERSEQRDYYWLLEKAGMPFPEKIESPKDINELCIVKLHHAQKKLERGFFTAASYREYREKSQALLKSNVITEDALEGARIERYIIGPVLNFDFFHSPVTAAKQNKTNGMSPLELLGIDWRFETSLDGHVRIPAPQQMSLPEHQLIPEMTVCGHNSATVRESLLEKVFRLGEMYVEATKEHYGYPVIGPFCLQTCVDKDLNFYIYDVAPRVGGGTNVHVGVGHPYGNSL